MHGADVPPESFGEFHGVVALWNHRRSGDVLPRWRDYDIPDFRGWFGMVSLARIAETPFDAVYEFFGTGLCALAARDLTGLSATGFPPGATDAERDQTRTHLENLRRDRGIGIRNLRFDTAHRQRIDALMIDLLVSKGPEPDGHVLSYLHIRHRQDLTDAAAQPWRAAGD